MKTLFAYTCFNRSQYYQKFLDSVARQSIKIDIAGFPDGARNQHDLAAVSENQKITAASGLDIKYLNVHTNLGITGNSLRLFEYGFAEGYDVIVFSEDDMVLSPTYLETLLSLQQYAETLNHIGFVSAYGPNVEKQYQHPGQVGILGHKWSFAINAKLWNLFRERALWFSAASVQQVNEWMIRIGYGHRNDHGYGLDAIFDACHFEHNLVPINTMTKHAMYIGAIGEHFNEGLYHKHSLGSGDVWDSAVTEWVFAQKEIDAMLLHLNESARKNP